MKLIDYHIHSSNSFDCKTSIDEICKKAIDLNMTEICFTDHFNEPIYTPLDVETYVSEVRSAQNKYKDKLIIKCGLEIAEPFRNPDEIKVITDKYDFDFLLGSVHNVENKKLRLYMAKKERLPIYEGYFNEVYKIAKYADVDVLAHFDLMKRYALDYCGNYEFNYFEERIKDILSILVERKIGLEINTSGLRSSLKETFPKVEILKLYKDLGGEIITIGSDSHKSKYLSYGYEEAINLLKSLGFNHIYKFTKRVPEKIKI
ncbi:histidinol-phosphatase HisJ family protein [Anaeromicrobium sediminis]|uniref:Histidinol-phosphatase n=1 Tax=Anaeromicrobium sediminis TaxID=1478221 RepID=A0A267M9R3_9FIRM|nr:histidinol-phosphatase HisJ family protein [Anaeromicrobium sediminis]PAB56162.1 hypothetical protein CCE28_21190 [Anaeromicrobium sediminis]